MSEQWMLKAFELALSVCIGAMAWWRRDTEEEDQMVAHAHDLVLDTVTGKNVRDQLTVGEAEGLELESRLRKFGWGRN